MSEKTQLQEFQLELPDGRRLLAGETPDPGQWDFCIVSAGGESDDLRVAPGYLKYLANQVLEFESQRRAQRVG